MRILAVAHDPGGANAVAAETAELRARGVDVAAIAKGPAQNQFRRQNVEFTPFHDGLVEVFLDRGVDLLLTGNSAVDPLERTATLLAAARGIRSVALVDYWLHHDQRFLVGKERVLPDFMVAIDEQCRREMMAHGLPAERIQTLGQPYFSVLLSRAREHGGRTAAVRRLLFASESGQTATLALAATLRAVAAWAHPIDLVVRFHPRETERGSRLAELQRSGCQFRVDDAFDPLETARTCDAVIGVSSMILIETGLMGVPTASFGFDAPALIEYGLCVRLASEQDIATFLKAPRTALADERFLAAQRDASVRVADFCMSLAHGS
jgi:hypothetical protein